MTSFPHRTPNLQGRGTGHHTPTGTMLVIIILIAVCTSAGQWELATALTTMAVAIYSPGIVVHIRHQHGRS
ncbi:hypothetical protein GCM10010250_65560 [Streptomyces althioticus]|nr:hypothetical protein GCM10010250_65560 [Streptomyces althioticus]